MKQNTRTKTAITDKIIREVETLAEKGFNNIMIAQSLNIGVETLSRNEQLKQSIQRGKRTLAQKVTETILDNLENTPTNQQMLVKRLCLFTPFVDIQKPTNAKEALDNLALAIKAYANGEINESQLRTIEAVSNSYAKVYEVTELEQRIKVLEEKQ